MVFQPTAQDKHWIVCIYRGNGLATTWNIYSEWAVICVLNAMPHFSFSCASEFIYRDKLQLRSHFVEVYVEFILLYGLHCLQVNFAKISPIMLYACMKLKPILPALTLGLLGTVAHIRYFTLFWKYFECCWCLLHILLQSRFYREKMKLYIVFTRFYWSIFQLLN